MEHGAGSREQGAGSREQGAKGKGQKAKGNGSTCYSQPLTTAHQPGKGNALDLEAARLQKINALSKLYFQSKRNCKKIDSMNILFQSNFACM